MEQPSSFIAVLKNKGFATLWLNQILVQLAYNSLNFALIIWVFQLTNSSVAVSLLIFSVYLPAVIFGLFAGIFIDLIDKRKIIIIIDLLFALLFITLFMIKFSLLPILIITFLINTLSQFYMPSESSSIPLIVKKPQLLAANSLFSITLFTMFLLGFGLSGPLISNWGIDFILFIGSLSLLIAFLLAFNLPKINSNAAKSKKKLLYFWNQKNLSDLLQIAKGEITATLQIIKKSYPIMFAVCILSGVQAVMAVMAVLIPAFFEQALNIQIADGSYIVIAPLGIGMIIGGLVVGKLGYLMPKRIIVSISVLVAGLILFAVGAAPLLSPAIQYLPKPQAYPFFYQPSLSLILTIGSFLTGIALVSIIIPSQTILHEYTKSSDRGKIFSVLGVFMSAFALIPTILVGFLSDYFGVMPVFILTGGTVAILGFLGIKPDFFFDEKHLPFKIRQFLGLGHWQRFK